MSKKMVTESFPFNDTALVMKVADKMFALIDLDSAEIIKLKCPPDLAIELREVHPEISEAWHMNKKHWNDVHFKGTLKESFVHELIDLSYDIVVSKLPQKIKKQII